MFIRRDIPKIDIFGRRHHHIDTDGHLSTHLMRYIGSHKDTSISGQGITTRPLQRYACMKHKCVRAPHSLSHHSRAPDLHRLWSFHLPRRHHDRCGALRVPAMRRTSDETDMRTRILVDTCAYESFCATAAIDTSAHLLRRICSTTSLGFRSRQPTRGVVIARAGV